MSGFSDIHSLSTSPARSRSAHHVTLRIYGSDATYRGDFPTYRRDGATAPAYHLARLAGSYWLRRSLFFVPTLGPVRDPTAPPFRSQTRPKRDPSANKQPDDNITSLLHHASTIAADGRYSHTAICSIGMTTARRSRRQHPHWKSQLVLRDLWLVSSSQTVTQIRTVSVVMTFAG